MLIMALDSSTPVAGVALLRDGVLLKEIFCNYNKKHSETMLPMINQALSECECSLNDVDAVAVTCGPGSFTGLRIGLATAKGLCMSRNIPLIAISTLEVLAHNIVRNQALVGTILDARKNEIYMSLFDVSGEFPQELMPCCAGNPDYFAQEANGFLDKMHKEQIILLGDGVLTYSCLWEQFWPQQWIKAPSHLLLPRASALASLAIDRYVRADFQDPLQLQPQYLRESEAEVRLRERV